VTSHEKIAQVDTGSITRVGEFDIPEDAPLPHLDHHWGLANTSARIAQNAQ